MSDALDPAQAATLLRAARDAIEAAAARRPPRIDDAERAPALLEDRATFVTLRSADGALRGCIGELTAYRPLIESVRGCAEGAATRDPRFRPVAPDEVDGLHIGISVLGPPSPIDPREVEVGRHGLIVQLGPRRGVLLPEVATDHGMDREAFLAATCKKAGLPEDAWRDPSVELLAFETEKLAE